MASDRQPEPPGELLLGLTRFRDVRTFLRYCRGLFDPPARRWPRAVPFATTSPTIPIRMSRHQAPRKPRGAAGSDDDKFVHGVLESSAWARENARTLAIAGVVVVALVVGFFAYRGYSNAREVGAANALNDLRTVVSSGNVQLALRDGEALVSRYNGTEAADEARLLLGEMYLQVNQPQQASEMLGPLGRDIDAPLGFNAAMLMGAAQEAAGQGDQALQTFTRIGRGARFLFQQIAGYEEAARVQTAAGDAAGAIATYERILTLMDENSAERGFYEMRIAELQAGGAPRNFAPPVVATDSTPAAVGAIAPVADTATVPAGDTTSN